MLTFHDVQGILEDILRDQKKIKKQELLTLVSAAANGLEQLQQKYILLDRSVVVETRKNYD